MSLILEVLLFPLPKKLRKILNLIKIKMSCLNMLRTYNWHEHKKECLGGRSSS